MSVRSVVGWIYFDLVAITKVNSRICGEVYIYIYVCSFLSIESGKFATAIKVCGMTCRHCYF